MIMIGVDGYMAVYAYIYRRLEMMKIYRAHDYNDMSRKAANIISAQIRVEFYSQSNKNNADTGVDCRVLINNINYVLWPTN